MHISDVVTTEIMITVTMYNIGNGAFLREIHDFLSDGNSNVCFISIFIIIIYEIFACQIEYQKFDLENEGQGQRGEDRGLQH